VHFMRLVTTLLKDEGEYMLHSYVACKLKTDASSEVYQKQLTFIKLVYEATLMSS